MPSGVTHDRVQKDTRSPSRLMQSISKLHGRGQGKRRGDQIDSHTSALNSYKTSVSSTIEAKTNDHPVFSFCCIMPEPSVGNLPGQIKQCMIPKYDGYLLSALRKVHKLRLVKTPKNGGNEMMMAWTFARKYIAIKGLTFSTSIDLIAFPDQSPSRLGSTFVFMALISFLLFKSRVYCVASKKSCSGKKISKTQRQEPRKSLS
ncbi:hypothetical protein OCU04_010592 [Sclerotinia nivalis]|uniref:Uncharacterized protein n=1 Tax=Sclerotinia nivalis TaxID=352851 RepID=A0A9X0ADM5_9HELO|nr:hypothetical protein OCU04_010592 [Sclerotinia nivalis]